MNVDELKQRLTDVWHSHLVCSPTSLTRLLTSRESDRECVRAERRHLEHLR